MVAVAYDTPLSTGDGVYITDGEVDDSVELFGRSLRLCSQRLLFVMTAHSTRSSARILHAFEN